jgi:hypothetical protein
MTVPSFFVRVAPQTKKYSPCPYGVCSEPNANPLHRAPMSSKNAYHSQYRAEGEPTAAPMRIAKTLSAAQLLRWSGST